MRTSDTLSIKDTTDAMRGLEAEGVRAMATDVVTGTVSRKWVEAELNEGRYNSGTDPLSNTKLKLVRGMTICEESSPSPFTELVQENQDKTPIQLSRPKTKEDSHIEDEEEENRNGRDKAEISGRNPRKMLSRDSSQEYTDSTGIDLHEFLVNTLKNNPRDRMILLQLEQDILDFINNNEIQRRKFPPMTSYHRMLVHRVSAYFGLEHNVDQSGKSVVVSRTCSTRIPDQKFSEHVRDDKMDDLQKRYILKRDDSGADRDNDGTRTRLKEDGRSKSVEEREEMYQRARERIFAQDCPENFPSDKTIQENEAFNRAQKRRQIFRSKDGWSANRSSSEEARFPEPRPWSSTDSDRSYRNFRPAFTKASSFGGVTSFSSSSSSRSTGRLSTTGSESSTSIGSSTGSIARSQPPLPAPTLRQPSLHGLAYPARCTIPYGFVPSSPAASTASASYCLLPLEVAQIPPSSILLHPHTGQPFVSSEGDVSAVVCNPTMAQQQDRTQQPSLPPPPPLSAPHQQQPANHVVSQPARPVQLSAHPVQHTPVSYPPQLLPVPPNHQYTPDTLGAQFSHMTLARQPSSEGSGAHSAAYPSMVMFNPLQQAGYMVTSLGQPSTAPTCPTPALPLSQPVTQQQGFMQQPIQQMPPCYCMSSPYPHSCQYRPIAPVHHPSPQSQQPHVTTQSGYQAVMPNQPPSYQGMDGVLPAPSPHEMVSYPSPSSYQVSVPLGSQSVSSQPQTSHPPIVIPNPCSKAPMPATSVQVYYSAIPSGQQSMVSSSIGFLPGPGTEHMQLPQTSPPSCGSQQFPGQQCTGIHPSSAGGMIMMHLTLPPTPQTPAHSLSQWKQHKHSCLDYQSGQKLTESPALDSSQSYLPLAGSISSPSQSLVLPHLASVKRIRPAHAPISLSPNFHRNLTPGQANGRVLEVTDMPQGICRSEADALLQGLCTLGTTIRWLPERRPQLPPNGEASADCAKPPSDPASADAILAALSSLCSAQRALLKHKGPSTAFRLTTSNKHYDSHNLEKANYH